MTLGELMLMLFVVLVCLVGLELWDFAVALRAYLRKRARDREVGR